MAHFAALEDLAPSATFEAHVGSLERKRARSIHL